MTKRKSFLLRLDPKLWQELNVWAAQELRSVNGQIEFVLREAVRRRKKIVFSEENRDGQMDHE